MMFRSSDQKGPFPSAYRGGGVCACMTLRQAGHVDQHIQNGVCAVHGLREGYELRVPDYVTIHKSGCIVERYGP